MADFNVEALPFAMDFRRKAGWRHTNTGYWDAAPKSAMKVLTNPAEADEVGIEEPKELFSIIAEQTPLQTSEMGNKAVV